MNHVCDKKVCSRVFSFNFFFFSDRVKKYLEMFLYLKFRFYLFAFSNLSLYPVFFHVFVFAKELVTRRNLVNVIVNFVLEFIYKFLIIIMLFKTLVLMNKILLVNLIISSKRLHFFHSMLAMILHF